MRPIRYIFGLTLSAVCAAALAKGVPAPIASLVRSASQGALVADTVGSSGPLNLVPVVAHLAVDPQKKVLVWALGDHLLFSGAIFDSSGANLSEKEAIALGLIPKPTSGQEAFALSKNTRGFIIGKAGPEVFVFADPNCSACHAFMQSIGSDIDAGKLRVRIIPVGFLKPDSLDRAAAILAAKNPAAAWMSNERKFDEKKEEGGYPLPSSSDAAAVDAVKTNTETLARISQGQIATPTLVYCDANRKAQWMKGWSPAIFDSLAPLSACHASQ